MLVVVCQAGIVMTQLPIVNGLYRKVYGERRTQNVGYHYHLDKDVNKKDFSNSKMLEYEMDLISEHSCSDTNTYRYRFPSPLSNGWYEVTLTGTWTSVHANKDTFVPVDTEHAKKQFLCLETLLDAETGYIFGLSGVLFISSFDLPIVASNADSYIECHDLDINDRERCMITKAKEQGCDNVAFVDFDTIMSTTTNGRCPDSVVQAISATTTALKGNFIHGYDVNLDDLYNKFDIAAKVLRDDEECFNSLDKTMPREIWNIITYFIMK